MIALIFARTTYQVPEGWGRVSWGAAALGVACAMFALAWLFKQVGDRDELDQEVGSYSGGAMFTTAIGCGVGILALYWIATGVLDAIG